MARAASRALEGQRWIPNPGPQTEAFFSAADLLLYGGQGGGGKSDLLLGLAMTQHRRTLILRRHYTDLGAVIDRAVEIAGPGARLNRSTPPRLRLAAGGLAGGRLLEFGAAKLAGDERNWQGQPHDLLAFDEAVQFLESQVRFLIGWNRPSGDRDAGQRCRTVLASNPPVAAEGDWIIGMFRPWLDLTHPDPAEPGELRWFVTDPDGKDREVAGPEPVAIGRMTLIPKSRTFIPAALGDNPFLVRSGYQATLDGLPEPVRSAVRDGNFMAARRDDEWQIVPTAWVLAAQQRWTREPPAGVPMCAMGVDIAQGGADATVIAARHDGWFAPLVVVPGVKTPLGTDVAGLVLAHRRDGAVVVLDMGGGYGGAAFEHLRNNGIAAVAHKGAEKSQQRSADRQLGFTNRRSEALWRLREALDPAQPGGSPIALPDDPQLVADLTAPRFAVGPNGIRAESKDDIVRRLGRSPDRGDAVVMAWSEGQRALTRAALARAGRAAPRVMMRRR